MTRVVMLSKACYVAAYRKKLEAIADEGIDLTLIVPPYWRFGRRREPLEAGNDRGYQIVVQNPRLNGNHHLHWYPRLGELLESLRPDLVHIDEEPYDLVTFMALREAKRRGIVAVFFTWQNLDRRYPLPFSWFQSYVIAKSDGAIAGNSEASAILHRQGWTGPMAVIPQFGVDPADYAYRRPSALPGSLRVGYVGRLWSGKGVDLLVEALAGTNGPWQLELLGLGPEESAVRRRVSELGVAERVSFLGSRPSREVPEFLRSIDVLVLPSRTLHNWKEQFGRVLIEAMACGTPVVGSDSGEIPHVIGDAGLVFAEGDVVALRACLTRVRDDEPLRVALSEAGRERVMSHYTQNRVAADTVSLYEAAIARSGESQRLQRDRRLSI